MAETETLHRPKRDENRARSSKHFTSFLYKASLAVIFLVIIPLFPSQAPEFIHQTVPSRSWELLHLVFVGIAVSYGLFSSRNQEEEGEEGAGKEPHLPKHSDTAQSYVSRLLQASSVFDDEAEAEAHADSSGDDTGKVETWSHQYLRKEPVVVVAKEQQPSVVDQQIGEKPLLLPVRSLKSRVSDDPMKPADDETSGVSSNPSVSRSSSKSGSKRFSGSSNLPSQIKSLEKLGGSEEKVEEKEAAVLPSPIPWRSRSGRMEAKEDLTSPLSPFSSMGDFDHFWAKPEAPEGSKPQLSASSRVNPDSRVQKKSVLSSELQAKSAEDFVRRKSFQKASPPPPPPPPPPLPPVFFKSSSMRTRTPSSSGFRLDGVSPNKDLRRSYSSEQKDERRAPLHDMGKSVRTFRSRKDEEFGEYGAEETASMGKTRKKTDIDPKPGFFEFQEGLVEDVFSESDEDSVASENDVNEEAASVTPKNEEVRPGNSAGDGGPDVDKKADEFIAKFREQIRLQRIDSIKKSSVEISRSLTR